MHNGFSTVLKMFFFCCLDVCIALCDLLFCCIYVVFCSRRMFLRTDSIIRPNLLIKIQKCLYLSVVVYVWFALSTVIHDRPVRRGKRGSNALILPSSDSSSRYFLFCHSLGFEHPWLILTVYLPILRVFTLFGYIDAYGFLTFLFLNILKFQDQLRHINCRETAQRRGCCAVCKLSTHDEN